MHETPKYVKEVQDILAHLDNDSNNKDRQPFDTNTPENEIDVYVEDFAEEERITFIRKKPYGTEVSSQEENEQPDLDTTPLPTKPQPQPVTNATIGVLLLAMLVPIFCIAVQLYFIVNPYTVTVTLVTKSQQITLNGTLQLGRVISPLTLSQSQTVPTTGKGHQDAKTATGYVTFYNGLSIEQSVPAGTTLTGSSGEQIVTDQDANIPPASPPQFGQVAVTAHALNPGAKGNIAAYDVSFALSTSLTVKNLTPFIGGQDERNFQTVAKSDIDNTAAPLKATLDQSMQNTLNGQLKSSEALTSSHCTPTTTADHRPGEEATQVKVTVSETCSAVAYNQDSLQAKVLLLLTTQAAKKLATGYSLLGEPQVTVTSATAAKQVMLSYRSVSTWIYALSSAEQKDIKKLIAGKTTEKAMQLLTRLPGVERVSLQSSGFGDATRIPKNLNNIHLTIFYGL